MSLYILRHQAAGYLHDFVFEGLPSKEQVKPIAAMLVRRHGAAHPKTGETWWLRAEPLATIAPGVIPEVASGQTSAGSDTGAAASPSFGVHGEGVVTPPEK